MQGSDSLAVNEEDTICIAKLFRRKDPDDWEEVYVGVCSVMEQVSCFRFCCFLFLIHICRRMENGVYYYVELRIMKERSWFFQLIKQLDMKR